MRETGVPGEKPSGWDKINKKNVRHIGGRWALSPLCHLSLLLVISIIIWLAPWVGKMNQIARARGQHLSRQDVWVIDQVWGQDSWILAKFFFCVFMDQDEVEVHKLAKKERGQYPAILTEQTWSIKDFLHGFWRNFPCGIQRVVPSVQDGSVLPARVANHSARFGSSCPLAELAIQ